MVACCLCGAYEYLHKDRAFHRFPKNKELREKWLAAIGRKEIYATAKICSNHFDQEDYNINEYNTKRTLHPGTVPHKNLERRKKKTTANNDSDVQLAKTNDNESIDPRLQLVKPSTNVPVQTSDSKVTKVEILQHYIITPPDHEYTKRVDYSVEYNDAVSADNLCEQLAENNEDLFNPSDKHLATDSISSQRSQSKMIDCRDTSLKDTKLDHTHITLPHILGQQKILNNINISHIKKIKLGLLNKGIFTMTRVNFTSDEAWNVFVTNQILQRKHNKRLQAKNIRLKKRVLSLRRLCEVLQNKNYLSKSGSDKIQEIVPPTVQEMLQIMLRQKKCQKFSDELKCFAKTLHSLSPAGYQYVRNTFLKCLPHVSTLDGKHKNEPGSSKQPVKRVHPTKMVKIRKNLKVVTRKTPDQKIVPKKIEVSDDPVALINLRNELGENERIIICTTNDDA